MRRGSVILLTVTALVLSHAGIAWLGDAAAREAALSNRATGNGDGHSSGNGSANGSSPWSLDALGRRAAERARKQAEEEAKEESAPTWREQIAAARAAIPPGADPAALLEKAIAAMPLGTDDFSAESVAAFGIWLDRDPAAALAWAGLTGRDRGMYDFGPEVERWMEGGAHRQLQDYLKRFPLAEDLLIDAAEGIAETRGPDFTLELAATLTNPAQRYEFLDDVLGSRDYAGRIAKIRALMNDLQAKEFLLEEIAYYKDRGSQWLEEVRAAGFPPAAMERYEREVAAAMSPPEPGTMPEPDRSLEAIAQRLKGHDTDDLEAAVPDADEWIVAVEQGRMTPQEMLTRVREAWPQAASLEAEIRGIIAAEAMPTDAVGTLRWLRETGQGEEEWRAAFSDNIDDLMPEQIAAVLAELPPGTELTEENRDAIASELRPWYGTDPEGYAAAQARMAGDDRQQAFFALMEGVVRKAAEEAAEEAEAEGAVSETGEGGGP